jgi:glucose-6-phosphate dehydrogenase assembly protein OpcA
VGRNHASRTIVCAVTPGRTTLDAVATVATDAHALEHSMPLTFETVIIDVGTDHLAHLDSIVDPLVVSDIPTLVWAPHGHWDAVDALVRLSQSVLVDSMDDPEVGAALRRAAHLLEQRNVVDLAWLRSTPWRERVAAMFDPPSQRARVREITSVTVRHHPVSGAAALLLCGWLGSRLGWPAKPLHRDGAGHAVGKMGKATITLDSVAQEVPGLAGLTLGMRDGGLLSLDRGSGGLHATRRSADGSERVWRLLGASRGEGGILGDGIRQSLVGDPVYGEALLHTSGLLEND